MNDDELTLLLLQTIRVNGNTMYLLDQGFTLFSLTNKIEELKAEGLARMIDDALALTRKGEDEFYRLNRKLGRRGMYRYVSRMLTMKDEPMPLAAVYVPPKRGRRKKK